jgi:hypothetical protein
MAKKKPTAGDRKVAKVFHEFKAGTLKARRAADQASRQTRRTAGCGWQQTGCQGGAALRPAAGRDATRQAESSQGQEQHSAGSAECQP